MEDVFIKYGFPGAVIAALSIFVVKLIDWHRKDRQDWEDQRIREQEESRKINDQHFDRLGELTDESNKVMREHSNILTGLKTLLENQNRR